MRSRLLGIVCVFLILYGAYDIWSERTLKQPAGVLVAEEPKQENLLDAAPFSLRGYRITPLANFELRARVLAREHYRWDAGAKLAPVDLALGWGPMSDSAVLNQLKIWQDGRWYQFRAEHLPLPVEQLQLHSANMHMIPADRATEKALQKVRPGQIIHLKGFLVAVQGDSGFQWRSSMTRSDSGGGACELIYVERFEVES